MEMQLLSAGGAPCREDGTEENKIDKSPAASGDHDWRPNRILLAGVRSGAAFLLY